jgi:hypothetical protein
MRLRVIAAAVTAALAAFVAPGAVSAQTGPAWAVTHLPPDVLSQVCAPAAAYEVPAVPLRVTGGQSLEPRVSLSPGDLVTLNAGRSNGMQVGQEFFARRLQKDRDQTVSKATPGTIRTAGWLRVYAVDEEMSLATVVYACDAIEVGDFLEPFALPTAVPRRALAGKPERDNYARVLAGNDRRHTFGAGEYIVIDRGKDHGIEPGAQFVVYHDKHTPNNFLFRVADAVAVDVRETSATLSITSSLQAVSVNDYVSMRK